MNAYHLEKIECRREILVLGTPGMTVQLPTPPSRIKFDLDLQIGFTAVKIHVDEMLLATDVHDNLENVRRLIDQQIYVAFKQVM